MFKEIRKSVFQFSFLTLHFSLYTFIASAQVKLAPQQSVPFSPIKELQATPVRNQGNTGTCWCFSGTSLLESQALSSKKEDIDLSEMYTVRNIYTEKARNYVLRQGKAQFSEGGLGHDVIRSVANYGAMPEVAYSGLVNKTFHDHSAMSAALRGFLDSLINKAPKPLDADWMQAYQKILDNYLGPVPATFIYNGKNYNPISFSKDVLGFNADDYVNITSFTHHPYYFPFILEIPDNFSNGAYYNVTLSEMTELVKAALQKGFTVMWDADVSNDNFRQQTGLALVPDVSKNAGFDPSGEEESCNADRRQRLFEALVTQDDHLMHITGMEQTKNGKLFFKVKNSWGPVGPYEGYIMVSETYFAMNTISLVIPRAAFSKAQLNKLGLH